MRIDRLSDVPVAEELEEVMTKEMSSSVYQGHCHPCALPSAPRQDHRQGLWGVNCP